MVNRMIERVEWNQQPKPPREWLVSACTTYHCTPFRQLYVTPPTSLESVQQLDCFFGNCNLKLELKAVGQVVVNGCTLENVYYVPRLNQNYFSCIQEGIDYLTVFKSNPEMKTLELREGQTLTAVLRNDNYVVVNEDLEDEGTVGFLGTALPLAAVNEYQWLLSAECSNHCCTQRSLFYEFELVLRDKPRYLTLLDGTLCEVKGIGTVNVNGFQLANVYYVPNYSVNIISIVRLVFERFQVTCEMDSAKVISDKSKSFGLSVFKAEKCGHCYMFNPHRFHLTSERANLLKDYNKTIQNLSLRRELRSKLLKPSRTFDYPSSKWLLSTTAAQHACKDEGSFSSYSEPPANWRNKYGIVGIGTIKFLDGAIEVKHIPSYQVNILSVSELVKEGYQVVYQPFHVQVLKNHINPVLLSPLNCVSEDNSHLNHSSINLSMVSLEAHLEPVNGKNSSLWLVDTESREHYSYNCDKMLEYRKFDESFEKIIYGETYRVSGVGNVLLKNGITLQGVLHVPALKHNFISASVLKKENFWVGVSDVLTISLGKNDVLVRTNLQYDNFWVFNDDSNPSST